MKATQRRLTIAAPQRAAAEAGGAAFSAGGNAIDAALAAAISLTACYPDNCALGGDLIAIVRRADGATTVVNASGPAAAGTDAAALRNRSATMPRRGPATVTVPGLIAGLHAVWSFGGDRDWSAAFAAGIRQAEHGLEVPPTLAATLATNAELIAADAGLASVFLDDAGVLAAGQTFRQPALAASMRILAERGPDAFYRGALGRSVIEVLRAQGSALTTADLEAFTAELADPLQISVRRRELLTAPPNSQGFLLPLILRAIEATDDRLDPLGDGADTLARIFQRAVADRAAHLGDPACINIPLDELLDSARLRELLEAGPPTSTSAAPPGSGDTVAVVTADEAGNCVSLIQSLFDAFGAGICDPQTGIACHNRGSAFSLDPASPNVIAPGKRPAHTLMPMMVLDHGRPTIVAGTMGGAGQPQILSQVLTRLHLGSGAAEAVGAPRWIYRASQVGERDELLVESRVPDVAKRSLRRTGLPCRELPGHDAAFGHAQLITLGADGPLDAASDPRSEGAALVVEVNA